jgi:uncharacterized protein (DUF305 family)
VVSTRRLVTIAAAVALAAGGVFVAANVVGADDGPTEVDVGFLRDMIDHHEQANTLALIALHGDASLLSDNLAIDVLASQRYEIGLMEGWLIDWGLERGAVTRDAMAWMGMHVTPDAMPGMASAAQIQELATLQGTALDRRFFELMIEHHEGGIHMAEAARDDASNPHVRWLARRIAGNQRREINEISMLIDALR